MFRRNATCSSCYQQISHSWDPAECVEATRFRQKQKAVATHNCFRSAGLVRHQSLRLVLCFPRILFRPIVPRRLRPGGMQFSCGPLEWPAEPKTTVSFVSRNGHSVQIWSQGQTCVKFLGYLLLCKGRVSNRDSQGLARWVEERQSRNDSSATKGIHKRNH